MKHLRTIAAFAVLALALAACASQPATTTAPVATNTTVPVYVYQPPTEPAVFAALAATEAATAQAASAEAVTLDPQLVTRGQDRYVKLDCGSCHGAKGEGTDKGSAIAGAPKGEDAFVKFLQTGGNLGNDHLYAGNKLSPTGAHNLYLYVVSVAAAS